MRTFIFILILAGFASCQNNPTEGGPKVKQASLLPESENEAPVDIDEINKIEKVLAEAKIVDTLVDPGPDTYVQGDFSKPAQPLYTPLFPRESIIALLSEHPDFFNDGFDYPVAPPDAEGYFKANKFGARHHLGEDWNGIGGGNSDLGDPVHSTANGLVTFTKDVCCGWGKVIRIVHCAPDGDKYNCVESVYAHLNEMEVFAGEYVLRGEQIGTIGTGGGRYSAHLHFELRSFINMALGPGYSEDQFGYLNPTPFIKINRPQY